MADIRVLLVDDDADARRTLGRDLRVTAGFAVTECETGEQALQQLNERGEGYYAAVLIDLVLEGVVSGEELLGDIRNRYPRLPVIVFTGLAPDMGIVALAKGAYGFLRRPLDRAELVNMVRGIAEQDDRFKQMALDTLQILQTDIAIAWRLDRRERVFRVAAWAGQYLEPEFRQNMTLHLDNPATASFLHKQVPIVLRNVQSKSAAPHYLHREWTRKHGWTSLFSIPLVHQNRIIGLVDSYTREPCMLSNREKAVLIANVLSPFARQAAESVRNADLSQQFQTLHEINRRLAGAYNEYAVTKLVISRAIELTGATGGWLYLKDSGSGELVLRDCEGIAPEPTAQGRELAAGITEWVAHEGKTANVPAVSQDERHIPIPGLDIGAAIAVPLRWGAQTVGVLTVWHPHTSAFTEDDQTLLVNLAQQAAIAIGQTRLTRHLQEVGRLALGKDLVRLQLYVVEAARDLTGAEVVLWEVDEQSPEHLRIIAHSQNLDISDFQEERLPIATGQSITAQAFEERRPIFRPDILKKTEKLPYHNLAKARRHKWHSFMTVPLLGREGRPLGSLDLYSQATALFSQPDADLMAAFANQVASTLEEFKRQESLQIGLQRIIAAIGSGDDPLPIILKEAAHIFGAEYGSFALVEGLESGQTTFYAIYERGQIQTGENIASPQKTQTLGKGITGYVARMGQRHHTSDVESDPYYDRWYPDTRSVLAVPLKDRDGGVIGVLNLESTRPDAFSPAEQDLCQDLAGVAAAAIEKDRLFRRRAQDIAVLQEVNAAITTCDLSTIARLITAKAAELTGAHNSSLWTLDEREDRLRLETLQKPEAPIQWVSLDEGISSYVVKTGEPYLCPDVRKDPHYREWFADLASSLTVPLRFHDRTIGVLDVESRELNAFTGDHVRLLESLADQAAMALQNARLFQQEQQRAMVLDRLQRVSARISSTLDLKESLRLIVESAVHLAGVDSGVVHLIAEDEQDIGESYQYPSGSEYLKCRFAQKVGLAWEVFRSAEPIFIHDVLTDPRASPGMRHNKVRSNIGLPLKLGQRVIGVLFLNSWTPRDFTRDEINILTMLAEQGALAIDKARSFRRIQGQRQAQIAAIGRIGASIAAEETLAQTLNGILASAVSFLGEAIRGEVRLLDQATNELVAIVSRGEQIYEGHRRIPVRNGIQGAAAREKKTQWVSDVTKDPAYLSFVGGTRSEIAVPMLKGNEVIGVFNVEHPQVEAFSEQDVQLVVAFASLATVAVENARLLEELRDRADRFQALVEVATAISATLDLDSLLATIARSLHGIFAQAACAVRPYDAATGKFLERVTYGEWADLAYPKPRPKGTTYYVLNNKIPYYIEDTARPVPKGLPAIRKDLVKKGVGAVAYLPLLYGQEAVGILYVNLPHPYRFSLSDRQILELFANQAATAIRNARYYERRVRDLAALHTVAGKIGAPLGRREILLAAVETVQKTLATACTMVFMPDDSGTLIPQATAGLAHSLIQEERRRQGQGLVGWVAQEGKARLVGDVTQDPLFMPFASLPADAIRSVVLAPLWGEGKVIGVILGYHHAVGHFDGQDLAFLETLATQAGIAVHQSNQRQHRLEAIRRRFNPYIVGNPVSDPADFFGRRQLLQTIVDGVSRNHYIIYGERRIGKTSMLFQLEHHLKVENEQDPTCYFLPVRASLEGVSGSQFFAFLTRHIARTAGQPDSGWKRQANGAHYGLYDFEQNVEQVVHSLQERFPERMVRIVLLLDEMDQFVHYKPQIHEQFRSVLQSEAGTSLRIIMAGVSIQRVQQSRTSPWYNLFKECEVQALEKEAAWQLVVEPVRGYYTYENKAVEAILDCSDLKPQEIQRLASLAVKTMLERIGRTAGEMEPEALLESTTVLLQDAEQAAWLALQEKTGEYGSLWEAFDDDQRQALIAFAAGDGLIDGAAVHPDGSPLFSPEDLYNVSCRDDQAAHLTYLFREWLRSSHP